MQTGKAPEARSDIFMKRDSFASAVARNMAYLASKYHSFPMPLLVQYSIKKAGEIWSFLYGVDGSDMVAFSIIVLAHHLNQALRISSVVRTLASGLARYI